MEEKRIMQEYTGNHKFITKFYGSLQNRFNIFFLMEFIEGPELFYAIREIGLLGTEDAQFYVA